MFRIGQRVVCVKEPVYRVNDLGLPSFERGRVYTITSFETMEPYGLFIHVAELDPLCAGHVRGFRPIVEKKAEISFTANAPKDSEKWDNRKRVKVRA